MSGDLALWRAVIAQALADAVSNAPQTSMVKGTPTDRRRARIWLTTISADFKEVCHLAGLDPQAVREHATKLIADHDAAIDVLPMPTKSERSCRTLTLDGETMTVSEWSERLGIARNVIIYRLANDWTEEKALTTPVAQRQSKIKQKTNSAVELAL